MEKTTTPLIQRNNSTGSLATVHRGQTKRQKGMTRRERLIATLEGEPVDRPAVNFYEVGGFIVDSNDNDRFNIYNSTDWKYLLEMADEHTDIIRMCSPFKARSHDIHDAVHFDNSNNTRNHSITTEVHEKKDSRFIRVTVKTPDRTLTSLTRRDASIDTIWAVEHLIKNTEDLKAYLQLPDEFFSEKINYNIDHLVSVEKLLGDKGIVMVDIADPLAVAFSLFSMENFTIIALTEQALFHQLLEKIAAPLYQLVEKVAAEFAGRLWRIFGCECACEPYLPPFLFNDYAVRYTKPMVDSIKKYGGFARIHCHGRIKAVMDHIVNMGADAIDPIEPLPQGDVSLDYIRYKYGKDLVLFGNIEISDIENMEPAEFEQVVDKAIREGTQGNGRGFVLMPSASPYGRTINSNTLKNYETMVRKIERY